MEGLPGILGEFQMPWFLLTFFLTPSLNWCCAGNIHHRGSSNSLLGGPLFFDSIAKGALHPFKLNFMWYKPLLLRLTQRMKAFVRTYTGKAIGAQFQAISVKNLDSKRKPSAFTPSYKTSSFP